MTKKLICEACGTLAVRTGPVQRYCKTCSQKRDLERKKLWVRNNPLSDRQAMQNLKRRRRRRELAKEAGAEMNKAAARSIYWYGHEGPELLWLVRAAIPFTYAASKNHIYALRRTGHVALRRESRQIRQVITDKLKLAIRRMPVVHNKLWIDILVQKPNHKGDAVNVIDLVCDAVKDAVPIDDRWFSVRRLDWEIVKENPRLFVGIGQDSDLDCQVCSYCGQIKPFSEFNRNKGSRLGIGRECRQCRREGRKLAKKTSVISTTCPPDEAAETTVFQKGI